MISPYSHCNVQCNFLSLAFYNSQGSLKLGDVFLHLQCKKYIQNYDQGFPKHFWSLLDQYFVILLFYLHYPEEVFQQMVDPLKSLYNQLRIILSWFELSSFEVASVMGGFVHMNYSTFNILVFNDLQFSFHSLFFVLKNFQSLEKSFTWMFWLSERMAEWILQLTAFDLSVPVGGLFSLWLASLWCIYT